MLQLTLIILHLLLSLLFFNNHLCLMLLIHHSQLAVLFFEKVCLLSILNHRLHQCHTEGCALVSNSIDIQFKFVLNSLHLGLQFSYNVFQLTNLNFPISPQPNSISHFILIIMSQPIVLISQISYFSRQYLNFIFVNFDHLLKVFFIFFSSFNFEKLIFPHEMFNLFFKSISHENSFVPS